MSAEAERRDYARRVDVVTRARAKRGVKVQLVAFQDACGWRRNVQVARRNDDYVDRCLLDAADDARSHATRRARAMRLETMTTNK